MGFSEPPSLPGTLPPPIVFPQSFCMSCPNLCCNCLNLSGVHEVHGWPFACSSKISLSEVEHTPPQSIFQLFSLVSTSNTCFSEKEFRLSSSNMNLEKGVGLKEHSEKQMLRASPGDVHHNPSPEEVGAGRWPARIKK